MEIEIRAVVKKTESIDKVRKAIANLFPSAILEEKEGLILGKAVKMESFKKMLEMQRIRDTKRQHMLEK